MLKHHSTIVQNLTQGTLYQINPHFTKETLQTYLETTNKVPKISFQPPTTIQGLTII
jgi:hypothetical protein